MTRCELRELAVRLSAIQAIVMALPRGPGFGFAASYQDRLPHADWDGVVAAELARSRHRIRSGGVFSELCVDRVAAAAQGWARHFAGVAPTPFLHDITTKNVIVDHGRLSGIVDVDDLCFGDPLFLLGLLRMALLARDDDLTYADAWVEILRLDAAQTAVLNFYTALFCVNFMGELGRRFNRSTPVPVNPAYAARLRVVLDRYLSC